MLEPSVLSSGLEGVMNPPPLPSKLLKDIAKPELTYMWKFKESHRQKATGVQNISDHSSVVVRDLITLDSIHRVNFYCKMWKYM